MLSLFFIFIAPDGVLKVFGGLYLYCVRASFSAVYVPVHKCLYERLLAVMSCFRFEQLTTVYIRAHIQRAAYVCIRSLRVIFDASTFNHNRTHRQG